MSISHSATYFQRQDLLASTGFSKEAEVVISQYITASFLCFQARKCTLEELEKKTAAKESQEEVRGKEEEEQKSGSDDDDPVSEPIVQTREEASALDDEIKRPQPTSSPSTAPQAFELLRPYAFNDSYQGVMSVPACEWRGKFAWEQRDEMDTMVRERAAKLVTSHFRCPHVPKGINGLDAIGVEGSYSLRTEGEAVFFHIWKNRKQGHRFHTALQRISQVKFETGIPSPLCVPPHAFTVQQGLHISVVWMTPLVNDTEERLDEVSDMVTFYTGLLQGGLRLTTTSLRVFRSADAKLYLFGVEEVMSHRYIIRNSTDICDEFRLEFLQSVDTLPHPVAKYIGKEVVPAAALELRKSVEVMKKLPSVTELVKMGHIEKILHQFGINLSFLYKVFLAPELVSSRGAVNGVLTQGIMSMMVARALFSFLESVLRTVEVPEYLGQDIHQVERILAMNHILEFFWKNTNSFVTDHFLPIMKTKFFLPADFKLSAASYQTTAIVAMLETKLNVAMDGTGKLIARFNSSPFVKKTGMFHQPRARELVMDLHLLEVNKLVEGLWERGKLGNADAPFCFAMQMIAVHSAFVVSATGHRKMYELLFDELELLEITDMRRHFILTGYLAETAPSAARASSIALQHVDYFFRKRSAKRGIFGVGGGEELPSKEEVLQIEAAEKKDEQHKDSPLTFSTCEEILRVERCRICAWMLNSTKHQLEALQCFETAVEGFKAQFLQSSATTKIPTSSTYFDLLLYRALHALTIKGPVVAVKLNLFKEIVDATTIGSDQRRRQKKAASALMELCAAARGQNDPENLASLIPATTSALFLHEAVYTEKDHRTSLVNYFHLSCLVRSSITAEQLENIHQRWPGLEGVTMEDVEQFHAVVEEGLTSLTDDHHVQTLIDSEWMTATAGRLISVAILNGLWHGAVTVLNCIKMKFQNCEEDSVGRAVLEQPIKILSRAHWAAGIMMHYYCRTVRRKWNQQVSIQETIHRTGVLVMQQMAFFTLTVRLCEEDHRSRILTERMLVEERFFRAQTAKKYYILAVPILFQMEWSERRTVVIEELGALKKWFFEWESLKRLIIKRERAVSMCNSLDGIAMCYRHNIEFQERSAHLRLLGKIELAARGVIYVKEAVAVREMLFYCAARVMQRILQGETLLRIVPALSLYFFSEEQNVRGIIEEEWASELEELRLKERVFKLGSIRQEQQRLDREAAMRNKERKKRAAAPKSTTQDVSERRNDDGEQQDTEGKPKTKRKTVATTGDELYGLWLSTKKTLVPLKKKKQRDDQNQQDSSFATAEASPAPLRPHKSPSPALTSPIGKSTATTSGSPNPGDHSDIWTLWKSVHKVGTRKPPPGKLPPI